MDIAIDAYKNSATSPQYIKIFKGNKINNVSYFVSLSFSNEFFSFINYLNGTDLNQIFFRSTRKETRKKHTYIKF